MLFARIGRIISIAIAYLSGGYVVYSILSDCMCLTLILSGSFCMITVLFEDP